VADWYDTPPLDNYGTPGDTLYNRPDRGLPPIAEIVDGLLADADARLDAIAARYGINRAPAEWPARVDADLIDQDDRALSRKYGGEAA
jgi:hypothetical protein